MSLVSHYRERLSNLQTRKAVLQEDLERNKKAAKEARKRCKDLTVAREVIQRSIIVMQEHLSVHLSQLVTEALKQVFADDPYEFQLQFMERRNSTECDLVFIKNGVEQDPLNSAGYGAVDIASFILRLAYLLLTSNRRLLIFDEPFKNLDKSKHKIIGEVVADLCKELDVQIIMVTHEPAFAEAADKVFVVDQYNGISNIREEV